jgi:hypothetical protein
MAGDSLPDYKALFPKEAELRKQAEYRQAEAEDQHRQEKHRNQLMMRVKGRNHLNE